ncbi:Leucine Rich repeats (2 copies) [compost metagenome]
MPPKEKPQLSAQELALLEWWIKEGADINKKVQDLKQNEKIKPVLLSFQTGAKKEALKILEIPEKEVSKADAKVIANLKTAGVVVIPVTNNSNYLSVSFVTAKPSADLLVLLKSLSAQLIWLNLANTNLDDKGMGVIAGLKNLVRINLTQTRITDRGLSLLKTINTLQYLNLTGTKITAKGLIGLKGLMGLQQVYLYQSSVNNTEEQELKKSFPKTVLDFGGYQVPTLAKDTTEVKP